MHEVRGHGFMHDAHVMNVTLKGWRWNKDNGLITGLLTEHGTIGIESWGCELGDWRGTFAQHRMGGLNCLLECREIACSEQEIRSVFTLRLPFGRYRVECLDELRADRILRKYLLVPLEDSKLGDFVCRLAMMAGRYPSAVIGGVRFSHANSNTKRQMLVSRARIEGNGTALSTTMTASMAAEGFSSVTYVRDERPDRWIVHHRLLATMQGSDEYVFRIWRATFHWRRVGILRIIQRVPLWLNSEEHWGRWPILQNGGLVQLRSGSEVAIESEVALEKVADR